MSDKCMNCHERDALPEQTRCYECGGYATPAAVVDPGETEKACGVSMVIADDGHEVQVSNDSETWMTLGTGARMVQPWRYFRIMPVPFLARLEAHESEGTPFTPEETAARHAAWDAQIAQRKLDPNRPVLDIPAFMSGQAALLDHLFPKDEAKVAEPNETANPGAVRRALTADALINAAIAAAEAKPESWAARKAREWIAEATPPKIPSHAMKPEAVQKLMELAIQGAIASTIAECARVCDDRALLVPNDDFHRGVLAARKVFAKAIRKLGEP